MRFELQGKNGIGKYAIVDPDDYDFVRQHKWYYRLGYALSQQHGKTVMMHRFILGITDKKVKLDHANGEGLDNRRVNLRLASPIENSRNTKSRINSTSKYKGVFWHKRRKKWIVSIRYITRRNIGEFQRELHAAMAYDIWAKELHGEFARLNFPNAINI